MTKPFIIAATTLLTVTAFAETAIPTNAPTAAKTISIQEMLVIGQSGMKLHSLAMITQSKVKGGVDESFLPGFTVCAEDPAIPVRSVTARLLGKHLVAGKDEPNPEAIALLVKLAQDDSADVRYSAVYHGLTQIKNKSAENVALLLDIALANREQSLYQRIVDSLIEYPAVAARILDQKLAEENNIAVFEIYEDMTGGKPPNTAKYLEMPSSRPRMFIFKGAGNDSEALKAELERELKSVGIENPSVNISGVGQNYVLLFKTYLTKDYLTVEKVFSDHGKFTITQDMWLTPELEIQIDAMQESKP